MRSFTPRLGGGFGDAESSLIHSCRKSLLVSLSLKLFFSSRRPTIMFNSPARNKNKERAKI